jgi:tRNA nucleotidyltransferase (CCA-adding enzyme)
MHTIKREFRSRGTSVVVVEFKRPKIIDDDLYPQTRKTLEGLKAMLEANDFVVVDKAFRVGEVVRFVLELQSDFLPRCKRHQGPPVWIDNAEGFLAKWNGKGIKRPFIDKGRWIVIAKREHALAAGLVRGQIGSMALGSDFRGKKGLKVIEHDAALKTDYRDILTELIDKRKPWER